MIDSGIAAERFDWRELPATPWKNGAGLTREIACAPPNATWADFDWRLSVAEVDRSAPFSAFPGVDRCIVLLRGAGMYLRSPGGDVNHRLDTIGAPFRFAGETPIDATLIDAGCTDFNVMTRRGRWSVAWVTVQEDATVTGGDATLLLGIRGEWSVPNASTRLSEGQACLWREPVAAVTLRPMPGEPRPAALLVRLCHDRAA